MKDEDADAGAGQIKQSSYAGLTRVFIILHESLASYEADGLPGQARQ
jgi:hypothetical protein